MDNHQRRMGKSNITDCIFYIYLTFIAIFLMFGGCAGPEKQVPYSKTRNPVTIKPGETKSGSSETTKKPKPYQVAGEWYQPLAHSDGFIQQGIASWYGEPFHGRQTANGEIYNMYAMTAAHKTLPLGTYVNVRNLNNNKSIVLKINDRGPFVRGRIIDLSKKAATELDVVATGTAPVEVRALGKKNDENAKEPVFTPVDYYKGNFTVQVGAFKVRENALALQKKLSKDYKYVHITEYYMTGDVIYRVRVGKAQALSTAEEYERILTERGYSDAFVIAE